MSTDPFTVMPMGPALQSAWLAFFDDVAFADNPRWASCYCQFPTADHQAVEWQARSAADNRAGACRRIAAGEQSGVVARDAEGRVVGWCNAGPRAAVTIWDDEPADAAGPGVARLGAITCFVVAPAWRGRGVSQALLAGACEHLRAQGFDAVQAWARRDERSPTANHTGSFTLYQRVGFIVWREPVDGGVLLRKPLG
jgi:GNAT superfamily N-acetyltransferase